MYISEKNQCRWHRHHLSWIFGYQWNLPPALHEAFVELVGGLGFFSKYSKNTNMNLLQLNV